MVSNPIVNQLSVGPRYVFFNSLAGKSQPIYKKAYTFGISKVNAAAAQLLPQQPNSDGLEKIKSYIETIGQIATNERNIEINFIQHCKSLLKSDNTGELIKNIDIFLNEIDTGKFDYYKLINLINDVLSKRDKLEEERQKIATDNLKLLSHNLNWQGDDLQESYRQAFEDNYGLFIQQARRNLLEPIYDAASNQYLEYQTSINSLFSSKINSALRYLIKSKTLEEKVKEAWSNNWNAEAIASELLAIVVKYVSSIEPSNLRKLQGDAIAKQIEDSLLNLKNNLTPEYVENIVNLMQQRTSRSIEEVVLTSRRGIADMFIALEATARKTMVKDYDIDLDTKELEKMEKGEIFSAKEKEKISKKIIAAVRKRAQEQFGEIINRMKGESYNDFKKRIVALKDKNQEFFKERNLSKNLQNCIKVKISGPSMAEYYASNKFKEQLGAAVFVPGSSILLKTDASASILLDDNVKFELPDTKNELVAIINSFSKDFLTKYKTKSKGTIDVTEAAAAYKEAMQSIIDRVNQYIEQQNASDEEKQNILRALNSFLSTNISVKDYTYGTTQLGFHGGSLGFSGEKAIENIETMYELGGITPIDKELLYFALINCSSAALGHALKDSLANYLLGGAALMLFDDGFTASNNFLQNMINNFGFAPQAMHIFALQTGFVPASFVYTQIYTNLINIYNDISASYYNFNGSQIVNGNRVVITNNISEANIPTNYHKHNEKGEDQTSYATPQSRWDYISNLASTSVNIEMIFMAGLLDIFEKIPQAFNI